MQTVFRGDQSKIGVPVALKVCEWLPDIHHGKEGLTVDRQGAVGLVCCSNVSLSNKFSTRMWMITRLSQRLNREWVCMYCWIHSSKLTE